MGLLDTHGPGSSSSTRTLVASLRGRRVPTFVARDDEDPTSLFIVEHLSLDGDAKTEALARVSALVGAPNARLARMRGAVERAGGLEIVSDFIDGELLEELQKALHAKSAALTTLCALRLTSDVLAGLHAFHGIAGPATGHGAVSPRTILVGLDGRVRLTELVRDGTEAANAELVRFVAPELRAGAAPTRQGDVFAVGILLEALVTNGDEKPSPDLDGILAIARRASAHDPNERFETAAAMLSALAGTFREAPSHADVARVMAATAGEQIRVRRATAETAPMLAVAERREAAGAGPNPPSATTSDELPFSRKASPFPGTLHAQSGPPSSVPSGRAPAYASGPPSSRRTDRPPPGFGYVPPSGNARPLEMMPSAAVPAAPALPKVESAAPPVVSPTPPPAVRVAKPTPPPPAAKPTPPPPAAASSLPRAATPPPQTVSSAPAVKAAPAASSPATKAAAPVAPAPAPVVAPPSPSVPAIASVATTQPNPETNAENESESRPTDSWRYASAKAVDPPRRAVTLPVPEESIIIDVPPERDQERTVRMAAPPVTPPASVPQPPAISSSSSPSTQTTSSKVPAVELHAPVAAAKPSSKLVPAVLAGVAVVAIAAGGFGLLVRGKSGASADGASPIAARGATPPALVTPVAAIAPAAVGASAALGAADHTKCPEGMVRVEGGVFTMGSDASTVAKPAHSVTVSAFCMDVVEVTVAKFKACSDAGDCKRGLVTNDWAGITPAEHAAYEPLCNLREPVEMANHPINCVDWERADIYCTAHGARLPTEAEWELAARGRDNRTYPWGNDSPSPTLANACGAECAGWAAKNGLDLGTTLSGTDSWAGTAPGKTFPAGSTPEGIADLAGNVAEWVADAYAPYTAAAQTNPVVPTGDTRVVRGGSFVSGKASALAATYRMHEKPTKRSSTIGFRCASPLGAPVVPAAPDAGK